MDGFSDQFTHVRTGDAPQNIAAMPRGLPATGGSISTA
jgi:hypothetical protein